MQFNPQSKDDQGGRGRTSLEKKFEALDKLIKSGQRIFGDYDNDDYQPPGCNDDDADCNEANCS